MQAGYQREAVAGDVAFARRAEHERDPAERHGHRERGAAGIFAQEDPCKQAARTGAIARMKRTRATLV